MSKVLIIGDSCTDIFIYGKIERLSPEAPVPVIKPIHKTENGGMAKNVKLNLEALGLEVDIITNSNDIKKIRYIDDKSNQMVMRVDEHDYCKPINRQEIMLVKIYDIVVVSDYCKGFLEEKHIEHICEQCDNVFIDTKKKLGDWIKNASFIKINDLEHKKNFEIIPNYPSLENKLIVTRGRNGCDYLEPNYPVEDVSVKDVSVSTKLFSFIFSP